MITRFAPSPTGYLHWGHARAAFEAFNAARRESGQCLLRIEDIDHTRCRPHFTDAIYQDLTWLGFHWPKPVRLQSQHINAYKDILMPLKIQGLIYPCHKTRAEVAADNARRDLAHYVKDLNEPYPKHTAGAAWRLSIAACRDHLGEGFDNLNYIEQDKDGGLKTCTANPAQFGDVILARKDIGVSYHIAVTHDDYLQGITHVIRGEDLKAQTDIHVLLQKLLGWPVPIYHHHGLVMGADGKKLAKAHHDPSLKAARESGMTPEQIWASVLTP